MSIAAWAAHQARSALEPFSYDAEALGPWQVAIRISHCGICHSDPHLINDDWSVSRYPLVPGHEIIGSVTRCAIPETLDSAAAPFAALHAIMPAVELLSMDEANAAVQRVADNRARYRMVLVNPA